MNRPRNPLFPKFLKLIKKRVRGAGQVRLKGADAKNPEGENFTVVCSGACASLLR